MAVLDIIINAIDNASKVIEGIGDKGSSAMKTLADNSKAIGAGMTAAGGAVVLLTDSAKKTNAALGVTGLQLGKTSDEMRDLALETTNITFPLDDVVDTFDLLTRAGMRSTEEIVATSNAFSDLGTALGYPASEMADTLIPAFNAFDIPLKDASDYVDTFTHLVRNTTVDLSDYANMVNYLAPQLDTMNLSVEESVAVMEALADKGIQGGAATREFRKAATQAEGDVSAFYAALGLTADEVATYTAEIKSADGITQEFAEAQEAQFGMVDHLKQAWDEWSFAIGSALEPLDGVGAVMTALGPIIMGIGPAMQTLSAIQTGTLIPSLTATAAAGWAAVAPWLPLVAAIAAVIAIAWLLYENWDEVATAICEIGGKIWEFFGGLWEGLLELFGDGFEGILGILFPPFGIYEMVKDNWGPITEFLGKLWDGALDIFGKAWDGIVAALFPAKGLGDMVEDNWGGIQEFVGKLWGKIVEFFGKGFENAIRVMFPAIGLIELVFKNWGPITQAVENIWDSVVWIFKSFYNTAASYGRDIVFGLWDGISSLYSWIHDQVTGFGESILGWVTDGLGALWPNSPSEAGVKIGAGLTAGIEKGLGDTLTTVRRAIDGLEDEMVVDVNPTVGMPIGGSQGGIRVEAGAGVQEVHYHFDGTFHIREEADIHKLAYELERMRSTKARMRGIGTW